MSTKQLSPFGKCKSLFFFNLRDGDTSPICWLTPKMPETIHLGQAEVKSQELSPDLPCEGQGANYLSHYLLPPTVHISRKQELGVEPRLKPRHSGTGCGFPKWCFNPCTKCPPLQIFSLWGSGTLFYEGSTSLDLSPYTCTQNR